MSLRSYRAPTFCSSQGDSAGVSRLDWHDLDSSSDLGDDFDLVIGSDLVYNNYDVVPLLSVISRVLTNSNHILLFIPLPPAARREALPLFLESVTERRASGEWLVEEEKMVFSGFGEEEGMMKVTIQKNASIK